MRYQMLFRIEANGVTPIPAPTRTAVSNLKTSSDAEPKGPSTYILGRTFLIVGSISPLVLRSTLTTDAIVWGLALSHWQPKADAMACVKFHGPRTWTDM